MKCSVLILFVFFAFAAAEKDGEMVRIITGLSRTFSISQSDVERCIHKTSATAEDLNILDEVILEDLDADKDGVRRATCAVTCCAQVQGTMIGSKLQLPVIHRLIQGSEMPAGMKTNYHTAVNECADLVKNITDDCEVGFQFVKCLSNKAWDYDH